ncbi:UNVERIFIED_CONTAM: Flap endonuclease 1 [Sesamum latifolium]|uniref:Flap endonuclease 1 n=1 Tax=Sesamum latifolium TaxID=2727402 RepID=A0AAW2XKC6_9LAMI
MGIKGLTKLLADNAPMAIKEQKLESYFGREIAIDASMSIYQFLVVVGRRGTEMLTNEAGEVTSHLQGMFTRTIRLMEAGIKPVYVFDGKPPDLKKQELAKRFSRRADATKDLNDALKNGNKEDIEKFSKRTVKVTEQHNEDCKKLLRLMGVPVIEAPCEAEAQCAALCRADKVLEELNLNMDQFIDLCILAGCDYCDSIRGIGGLTALKLIRQHGSIEHILENINKQRYQIPDDWPYQEARWLFKEPSVLTDDDQLELKWTAPDEDVIEFGKNLVFCSFPFMAIPWLGSFSKPVVRTSVTAKAKGTKCVLTVPKPVTKLTWYSTGASFHSRPIGIGSIAPPSIDLGSKQSMPFTRSLCCGS